MIALSNLARYLGLYDYWKRIVEESGFGLEKRTELETVMGLLETNLTEVSEWLLEDVRSPNI